MAQARTLVFKCTNANLMLHQLGDLLSLDVVVLLRHPCAVVASQLTHGAWEDVTKENPDVVEDMGRVLRKFPKWKSTWSACTTQEEVLAFIWGVRTAIPLRHSESSSWLVTTYEDLVEAPKTELPRIFEHVDQVPPKQVWDQLGASSATTQKDSNVVQGKSPLTTWQRRLSDGQVSQILSIVHDMGITVYSEDLRPRDGHPALPV
jgi:hypothetical protein